MKRTLLLSSLLLIALLLSACGAQSGTASILTDATPTPTSAAVSPSVVPSASPQASPAVSASTQSSAALAMPTPSAAAATPVPPTPTASPSPVSSESAAAQADRKGYPVVTKHPTSETVKEGGACSFVAKYDDAIWAEWYFVNPDGSRVIRFSEISGTFPTLSVQGGGTNILKLSKIPLAMNGWQVYCDFSNKIGHTLTDSALITVTSDTASTSSTAAASASPAVGARGTASGAPVITKHPTDETVEEGGSCYFVAKYKDAIWAVWHFVSPDGSKNLDYLHIKEEFPDLKIKGGETNVLQLLNIPLSMNGWTAYCDFSNKTAHSLTDTAKITVKAKAGSSGSSVVLTPSGQTPVGYPVVTKDPTDETVKEGGSCYFIARYQNAKWAVWHFVSPDGKTDLDYLDAKKKFPDMVIKGGETYIVELRNIPYDLNGWTAYCEFSNDKGSTKTESAKITVTTSSNKSATATPTPSPSSSGSGTVFTVTGSSWQEAADLKAASEASGISFSVPVTEALPEGLSLSGYRYQDGALEVRYSDAKSNILTIRKSDTLSGRALSGDINSYPQSWNLTLKGLTLSCVGDGNTINTATFGTDSNYYSISYNVGSIGNGLTPDQLNSLINGMQ